MTPSEHFMRHAAECRFMAQLARDKESRATWMGMAERWHRCADLAKQQNAQCAKDARRRKSARTWSQ